MNDLIFDIKFYVETAVVPSEGEEMYVCGPGLYHIDELCKLTHSEPEHFIAIPLYYADQFDKFDKINTIIDSKEDGNIDTYSGSYVIKRTNS